MRNLYILSLLAFLTLACDALPDQRDRSAVPPGPEELLLELNDGARLLSVDKVADLIINMDPSLLLVDVRPHAEYDAYTLPGAINIPLENILDDDNQLQLDCRRYMIVFFSNGSVDGERAWFLTRQRPCTDIYVMHGGLNEWVRTILNPQEPPQTASAEELERYSFRRGASKYFTGGAQVLAPEPFVQPVAAPSPPKKIEVKPKKKQQEEEEGC